MSVTRDVRFIQYLRPNGRRREMLIDRPEEVAAAADRIWAAGYRLEAEVLRGSIVSFTIGDELGDYAHELTPNGPGIEEVVDRLILSFDERLK